MTTLRVFFADPPDAEREAEWALFDPTGRFIRRGQGQPAEWPRAEQYEAVASAASGRLVALKLPPLQGARVAAAVRYALEDQLADAPENSHVAHGPQRADGTVRVAIIGHPWMRRLLETSRRLGLRWRRALLESDLAQPPAGSWRWCADSIAQPGFVVTDRGASIATGPVHDDAIPSELAVALAREGDRTTRNVRVDAADATPALLARWKERYGRDFLAGVPWHWHEAKPESFASAIDLLAGSYSATPAAPRAALLDLFRPAAFVAAAAIGIFVLATLGHWISLRWQAAAIEREMKELAQSVAPAAGDVPPQIAIARRESELRHQAGMVANDDLLPLLARASPVLGELPAGALRSINYSDGHVVLELLKLDPARANELQQALQRLGLTAIAAPTASGARVRMGLN